MHRELELVIDKGTWPTGAHFPASFTGAPAKLNVDIISMLHLVGLLTTPVTSTGVTLSEFWAWIRYANAVSGDADFRITNAYAELDAHQKTILSDDFGMGVPMWWLTDALSLGVPFDGRYFIQRWPVVAGLKPVIPPKKGPSKAPDFVALGSDGLIHVIECKGTQGGPSKRAAQFHSVGKSGPSGAVVQKGVISIPTGFRGQSLATGLCIGLENVSESSLLIRDPPLGLEQVPPSGREAVVLDPMIRGPLAKILRASGLWATANLIASPSGDRPWSPATEDLPRTRRTGAARRLETRRGMAREELLGHLGLTGTAAPAFRQLTMGLPRPLVIDDKPMRVVSVEQQLHPGLLMAILENGLEEGDINDLVPDLGNWLGPVRTFADGPVSVMSVGKAYRSVLRFSPLPSDAINSGTV